MVMQIKIIQRALKTQGSFAKEPCTFKDDLYSSQSFGRHAYMHIPLER